MDKVAMREEMHKRCAKFTPKELTKNSNAIASHISVSRLCLEGKVIMGFLATHGEVNIDKSLQQAISDGKIVCVPQILEGEGNMQAVRLTSLKGLGRDRFGIRTPKEPCEVVAPEDIDVVLTPGLAFTEQGARLGKGKGYYDRFLPRCTKAVPVGVGFDAQVVKELPTQGHDANIRYLVTEKGLRVCK